MGAVGSSAEGAAEAFVASSRREILPASKRWSTARQARLEVFGWLAGTTPAGGTWHSASSAHWPTKRDQLHSPAPHDNRCPQSRGKPLRMLPRGRILVIHEGCPPVIVKATPIWARRDLRDRRQALESTAIQPASGLAVVTDKVSR
jgi:hypothetical protein